MRVRFTNNLVGQQIPSPCTNQIRREGPVRVCKATGFLIQTMLLICVVSLVLLTHPNVLGLSIFHLAHPHSLTHSLTFGVAPSPCVNTLQTRQCHSASILSVSDAERRPHRALFKLSFGDVGWDDTPCSLCPERAPGRGLT